MAKNGTFAIDETTGDLLRVGGKFVRVKDAAYLAQKVRSVLRFFLGEWFLDLENVGLPYFQEFFVKSPKLALLRSRLQTAILSVQGIVSVDEITLKLGSDRKLRVDFKATADLGQLQDTVEIQVAA